MRLIFFVFIHCAASTLIYKSDGDLNIGFLIESRMNSALQRTLINSAIWTADRLNNIKQNEELEIGLAVYSVKGQEDYFSSIYEMYHDHRNRYLLGFMSTDGLPDKVDKFSRLLNVETKTFPKFTSSLIKAAVKLLEALNWVENIQVVTPDQFILREFYRITRKQWMCVKDFIIYDKRLYNLDTKNPLVVFGDAHLFGPLLRHLTFHNDSQVILVPLDGSEVEDPPDGSYIIQPLYSEPSETFYKPQKVLPTPLLFEVANPVLTYAHEVFDFIQQSCNETVYKLNCVRNKMERQLYEVILQPERILKELKIEPLLNEFVYNIYRVENISSAKLDANISEVAHLKQTAFQNYVKTFTYNPIDGNLSSHDGFPIENSTKAGCTKEFERCVLECENFKSFDLNKFFGYPSFNGLTLRPEPWVYAFIALSALGVLFCLSIFCFITVKLCQKQVLEGNPFLTMFLLACTSFMFCGVIPFAIEGDKFSRYSIYLGRALCVTLPYSMTFSLLLARTILLATVSKEVGFMSHVAGSVQSFLTLFIFAVQCALSLQLRIDCEDVFRGNLLLYLLSYNVILLILLIFTTPLVLKSQRNYKEGKYITIAIMLIAVCWSFWLPGYAVFDDHWKDPMLCLGLVTTAGILLGVIFIPRTYLMTVSAARERFTSALPSLATATSAMDIYRASTQSLFQPVYDCVNVAAISAANSLRSVAAPLQPPSTDFYSNRHMAQHVEEEEDDFQVINRETPTPDKVTRF
ncbi:PREDICTED: protein bride of sevenless isoform X2 [Nicrophorus vespilloides]|uniref:Protein bride of sevenless isoform X2 n=1 Tax=Nicrophorus vespilloides TaxID=110193 RepID=A0ABM1NI68_NICVS|nr:PREDICTED: protein bride of sevenless isoform X2 [Nicrophorus vespilloides]